MTCVLTTMTSLQRPRALRLHKCKCVSCRSNRYCLRRCNTREVVTFKTNLTPDQSNSAKTGLKKQISPYSKGTDDLVCQNQDDELISRHVKVISLGSLSSQLSKRYIKVRRPIEKNEAFVRHTSSASATVARMAENCAEMEDKDQAWRTVPIRKTY